MSLEGFSLPTNLKRYFSCYDETGQSSLTDDLQFSCKASVYPKGFPLVGSAQPPSHYQECLLGSATLRR